MISHQKSYFPEKPIIDLSCRPYRLSTVRTVFKIWNNDLTAARTSVLLCLFPDSDFRTLFIKNGLTVFTDLERSPLFYRNERDEKEAQIMIHSF